MSKHVDVRENIWNRMGAADYAINKANISDIHREVYNYIFGVRFLPLFALTRFAANEYCRKGRYV